MTAPRADLGTDLRSQDVEIRVSRDGKTLWVNTIQEGCILRIHDVGALAILDDRTPRRRRAQAQEVPRA